jgi:hypothetical protein
MSVLERPEGRFVSCHGPNSGKPALALAFALAFAVILSETKDPP